MRKNTRTDAELSRGQRFEPKRRGSQATIAQDLCSWGGVPLPSLAASSVPQMLPPAADLLAVMEHLE